jgi:PKD repeat protein
MCHPCPDQCQDYYHHTMKNSVTKTTVKALVLAAFSVLIANTSFAQAEQHEDHHCGLTPALNNLYQKYPGLQAEAEAKHAESMEVGKRNLENNRSTSPPLYIIPVVFHIIHDYGTENISDAQILDQVAILNRDYRKLNADTSQIVAPFDSLAADSEIEFRLAQIDPDGNCTNGIDRIASMETYVGDDESKLNRWPREKYMNVWVVKDMMDGVAGYAYYPGAVDGFLEPFDGIIILQDYIGSIGTSSVTNSRALTHEVGHWLSLSHTWGNTNQPGVACGDDGILDTPQTKGWTTCNLTSNEICTTGEPENVQNYMEYAYCSKMFTYGQVAAMHYAINAPTADRSNLWTAANLAATGCLNTQPVCMPHADFKVNSNTPEMVCEGSSVTLTDLTWSSGATSWAWTLTAGATVLTSTAQNPTFTNMVPGVYTVELIATNATGTDTEIKTDYLVVSPDQAMVTPLYSESFEDPNYHYLGYYAEDMYGNGSIWHRTTGTAYTGSACMMLNNYGVTVAGDSDEFITPSYDLRFNTGLQLTVRYAFATGATDADLNTQSFRVMASTDCGQTWTQRWSRSRSNVVTAGLSTSYYVPANLGQWELITINLPSNYNTFSNVRFKFCFGSGEDGIANNLFLDDINVLSTNVGIGEVNDGSGFSIYPNPGDGNSTIAYSLTESANVLIDVYDVSGRLVSSQNKGEQGVGNYNTPVSEATLAPGTYMIQMTIGDRVTTRKYVVTQE